MGVRCLEVKMQVRPSLFIEMGERTDSPGRHRKLGVGGVAILWWKDGDDAVCGLLP